MTPYLQRVCCNTRLTGQKRNCRFGYREKSAVHAHEKEDNQILFEVTHVLNAKSIRVIKKKRKKEELAVPGLKLLTKLNHCRDQK